MRSILAAVAIAVVTSATPVWAETPTRVTDTGGDRLSYDAGDLCEFPITYRYRYVQAVQLFSSGGVDTRILQHWKSWGWFRNDLTGKTITFRSSLTTSIDLTVEDFTSDYFVHRGMIDLYRSEDGGVLAVRRGQFRLNRFGDVTFDAAGASNVVDVCPFLA